VHSANLWMPVIADTTVPRSHASPPRSFQGLGAGATTSWCFLISASYFCDVVAGQQGKKTARTGQAA